MPTKFKCSVLQNTMDHILKIIIYGLLWNIVQVDHV